MHPHTYHISPMFSMKTLFNKLLLSYSVLIRGAYLAMASIHTHGDLAAYIAQLTLSSASMHIYASYIPSKIFMKTPFN